MARTTVAPPHAQSCAYSRAARELSLKRSQFDLAVNLGRIRTVPDEGAEDDGWPAPRSNACVRSQAFPTP